MKLLLEPHNRRSSVSPMIEFSVLLLAAAIAVTGCAQPGLTVGSAVSEVPEVPAVVVLANDASGQALRSTVAHMMGVASVAVANDVLLKTSLLVIEKNRPRGVDGIQLSGRDYDKPEQFRLFKSAQGCVLVRLRTGAREVLPHTQCTAE